MLGEHLDELACEEPEGRQIATQVFEDRARTIINKVDSPDIRFSWTINPYRGCEHGCIYCYARPTHEHFGLSCGVDFDTKLFAKTDAAQLLRKELMRPSWKGEPIVMSGVTDPYQPIERRLRITRACLGVMREFNQPVGMVTKNHMITRDLDLLGPMGRERLASAAVSVTSLDPKLSAAMEPRASSPGARLRAIEALASAGVRTAVMVAPVVPGLNDREVPAILEAASKAGATGGAYVLLRLPWQVKGLFLDWLAREFPDRAGKVRSFIEQSRGGQLYDAKFGTRMTGQGPIAGQIGQLFELSARRLGLSEPGLALRSDLFRRPVTDGQGLLF